MPKKTEDAEQDLTFVGLFGIIDPPRPEARDAVARCTSAGIRTVMITGDHPLTARHIAKDLGISQDGNALTGSELSQLSQDELEDRVEKTHVYARVSPEHKLRIVQGLQTRGQIVSMTRCPGSQDGRHWCRDGGHRDRRRERSC
jgi:Ca2+-transporting ATPase